MKIYNSIKIIILILATHQLSISQSAYEIVKKSEEILKGKTSKGRFKMTVITPEYTRTMEMESWWVENEKALIVIKSPKREAGNKTLKIKNELWMYLRNTETTIKIPPSMMLQSWNGSDFTNDDLVRESNLVEDYFLTLLGEDTIESNICWKVELRPKPTTAVVWGKILYWCRKKDFLPVKTYYFDEKEKLIRSLIYSDYKVLGGRLIPSKWIMLNHVKKGNRTEFEILDIQFDIKISDRIFSFQELEKGR
ncbi:MAG: Outer membrane lipoprotein-sorting protein [Ignavibacteriae bacterium]|nr:MAG: Outer membrane lipoprotein-sorting protein [Ignavibacteriota bacterium]